VPNLDNSEIGWARKIKQSEGIQGEAGYVANRITGIGQDRQNNRQAWREVGNTQKHAQSKVEIQCVLPN
jgi:hypothetical protein